MPKKKKGKKRKVVWALISLLRAWRNIFGMYYPFPTYLFFSPLMLMVRSISKSFHIFQFHLVQKKHVETEIFSINQNKQKWVMHRVPPHNFPRLRNHWGADCNGASPSFLKPASSTYCSHLKHVQKCKVQFIIAWHNVMDQSTWTKQATLKKIWFGNFSLYNHILYMIYMFMVLAYYMCMIYNFDHF